jgi:glycerophosphoryl diester phosphodiesterase
MDVDMVELDVYECASHELVVMHDDTLERTTNGNGNVWEKNLYELKLLDAGKGQQIPTLAEVFDLVDKRVKINIELKGKNTAIPTAQLIYDYVDNKGWAFDDFYVSSFDYVELALFKQVCFEVTIGGLYEGTDAPLAAFKKDYSSYWAIGISKNSLTQEYIDEAHHRNLKIYVYTVNDVDEIDRIKKMGVDGIFCNYPDRLH